MSFQIFKTKCKITEKIFVGLLGVTLLLLIFNAQYSTTTLPLTIAIYTTLIVTSLMLFYLSYVDFKSMEIDNGVSLSLMLFLLLLNLFLHFFLDSEIGLAINENFTYLPYDNFFLALFLGLIFLLIVVTTKEKAMGSGDIRIAIIVGLLIGKGNSVLWVYITVFSALLYGLILGYRKKKFKGLKIPFAPFMILGAIVSLLIDMYI